MSNLDISLNFMQFTKLSKIKLIRQFISLLSSAGHQLCINSPLMSQNQRKQSLVQRTSYNNNASD